MTKLTNGKKKLLNKLGIRIKHRICKELGYKTLGQFSTTHPKITKSLLYEVCEGSRDIRISTLIDFCEALEMKPSELLKSIDNGY